jgi:hypothetical protein
VKESCVLGSGEKVFSNELKAKTAVISGFKPFFALESVATALKSLT